MAVTPGTPGPTDFETIESLREALARGRVRRVPVYIVAWRLNGTEQGAGPAVGPAKDITYDIRQAESDGEFGILKDDVPPSPRRYSETSIVGGMPGELAEVVIHGQFQSLRVIEFPSLFDCDEEELPL